MKHIFFTRSTFTRQQDQNDCGPACMAMILRYAGMYAQGQLIRQQPVPAGGLSLLDLKHLANQFNLSAKCVKMDIESLRRLHCPCILHVRNQLGENHFIVCYGVKNRSGRYTYLVGDPARQVYFEYEHGLEQSWETKTALCFDGLVAGQLPFNQTPLGALLNLRLLPMELWTSVALLNICTMLLGLGISWVLQKGVDSFFLFNRDTLIFSVISLLFIITLAKCMVNYVRQKIIIALNTHINDKLLKRFIKASPICSPLTGDAFFQKPVKDILSEIQKIQQAISFFAATVISDSLLILMILSWLFYIHPLIGLINLGYTILITVCIITGLPLLSYDYAQLNELSGIKDNFLAGELNNARLTSEHRILPSGHEHYKYHEHYLSYMKKTAIRIIRHNLIYECLGTVAVIAVFLICIKKLQEQAMPYSSFLVSVILSYFLSMLMIKISNAVNVISDGAESALQNQHYLTAD